MSDMSSALIRLGRLMELQGIAPSPRAGAAAETVSKRKSKGASGGGGATATAAETEIPPQGFGARRISGQTVLQITAGDLGEVFDPADFKSEWTPGEVERVMQALPGLQLPFDPANVAASIGALDQLAFEARAKDSTPALVDADVAQGNGGFALWGDVTNRLTRLIIICGPSLSSWALRIGSAQCTLGRHAM